MRSLCLCGLLGPHTNSAANSMPPAPAHAQAGAVADVQLAARGSWNLRSAAA